MHRKLFVALLLSASFGLVGQSIPDFTPPTPLFAAVMHGDTAKVKSLLKSGTHPNDGRFIGMTPLSFALAQGYTEMAKALVEAGADVNAIDPAGSTTLMWAAYNEEGDPSMVELLIEKGVKVEVANKSGETALTWALRRGYTPVVQALRQHGASDRKMVVDSVQRAVAALQKSGPEFTKVSGCASCHNQSLPQMTYAMARERGVAVDAAIAEKQSKAVMAMYKPAREIMLQGKDSIPDPAISVSYALLGMAASGYPADETTAAMAYLISTQQNEDGSFRCLPGRPPMESSKITATALSIRVMQIYGSNVDAAVAKGLQWLRTATAKSTEERAMKVLGLAWAKAETAEIRAAARMLTEEQRMDGGWAQLPALESDAYATGQALYALQASGMMTAYDEAFLKGAGFLLRTQRPDGSWLVRTRSNPFQPLKESGFPHGKDQWISAAGTSWAALALGMSLPPSASQVAQAY